MKKDSLYAVIIAGGRGKRFWPLSREAKPKQLIALNGTKTLLHETIERISPLIPKERIYIITASSHSKHVLESTHDIPVENIIIEPQGRNTAPAIALPASILYKKDPDALMVVLPADHIVGKEDKLIEDISEAIKLADEKRVMVTFGIRPTYPETGYGYIEINKKLDTSFFGVQSFTEKPNRKKAKFFLESGRYLWNSGMFVFRADIFLDRVKVCLPSLHSSLEKYFQQGAGESALTEFYGTIDSISVDHGVMEKSAEDIAVLAANFSWNDVGSWSALDDIWKADETGNRKSGCELVSISSESNTIYSKKLVALLGVDNLIIVETDDALLICKKDRAQEIKSMVEEIERRGYADYL